MALFSALHKLNTVDQAININNVLNAIDERVNYLIDMKLKCKNDKSIP